MNIELRCAIEYRADESRLTPGRLVGTILTYGEPATDRPERFLDGALTWAPGGVVLNQGHDRKHILTRFVPEVRDKQVLVDVPLPDTQACRDCLALVRNGTMKGFSAEFVATEERQVSGMREIASARLVGAAVATDPAYDTRVEVRARGALPGWKRAALLWI